MKNKSHTSNPILKNPHRRRPKTRDNEMVEQNLRDQILEVCQDKLDAASDWLHGEDEGLVASAEYCNQVRRILRELVDIVQGTDFMPDLPNLDIRTHGTVSKRLRSLLATINRKL